MLTVIHDTESPNDNAGAGRSSLDAIVRDGARQMVEAALRAEVAAYVERFVDQVDEHGRRLVPSVAAGAWRDQRLLARQGDTAVDEAYEGW